MKEGGLRLCRLPPDFFSATNNMLPTAFKLFLHIGNRVINLIFLLSENGSLNKQKKGPKYATVLVNFHNSFTNIL